MTTWVSADHHWGHQNIIKYVNRPFDGVREMNEIMIQRWQEVVGTNDTVYHLGDFTLGGVDQFLKVALRLTGKKIYIIPGGHDRRWISQFEQTPHEIHQRFEILPLLNHLKIDDQVIVMCHYPLYSWEKSHYGSLHLHGHCHGTIGCTGHSGDLQLPPGEKVGQRVDIGVDCWDFYPVSLDRIQKVL